MTPGVIPKCAGDSLALGVWPHEQMVDMLSIPYRDDATKPGLILCNVVPEFCRSDAFCRRIRFERRKEGLNLGRIRVGEKVAFQTDDEGANCASV